MLVHRTTIEWKWRWREIWWDRKDKCWNRVNRSREEEEEECRDMVLFLHNYVIRIRIVIKKRRWRRKGIWLRCWVRMVRFHLQGWGCLVILIWGRLRRKRCRCPNKMRVSLLLILRRMLLWIHLTRLLKVQRSLWLEIEWIHKCNLLLAEVILE